jgi:hypothetical protein
MKTTTLRRAWLGVLVAIVCAGFAGYQLAKSVSAVSSKKDDERRVIPPESQIASVDTELRKRFAMLEKKVGVLAAVSSERPVAAPNPQASEAPSHRPTREELEQDDARWHSHMAGVHAGFLAEPIDGTWAQATTVLLRDNMNVDEMLGKVVRNVECRSTMCRVELVENKKEAFSKSLSMFFMRVGKVLPSAEVDFVENVDGTRTASVYLSSKVDPGT